MDFKDADPLTMFIVSIAVLCIGLAIFYYLIKAAVKNGILAANEAKIMSETGSISEPLWTPKQIELQKKYERGELSNEEYKTEWDKL
ncbi:MAG TPA: hypothetical protein VK498_13315 [Ferruginibacter sp.]|nr:hypothetical protein [Ferruginibacter sp.]